MSAVRAARETLATLWRRRGLLLHLTRREVTEKHAGQVLGAAWAIAHPMILIAVYVFLFSVVFRARLDVRGLAAPGDYTIYILGGLIPWLMFQESMAKGTSSILANANLVKQVVFPVELLPVKVVLGSVTTLCVLLGLLLVYVGVRHQELYWSLLALPVLIVLQLMAMVGVSFVLGSVGCYVRDLREVVTVFGMVNTYLIPAVYLPEWVPATFRPILYLNPFSHMIWCYQDAIFYRAPVHPWSWLVFPLLAAGVFLAGCWTFRRLEPFFGNVL